MPVEIKCLHIERFRGFESLVWRPHANTNVLLGGGDVGKTTILDAIGLLLSPSTSYTLAEADYLNRDVEREFSVNAVISIPGGAASRQPAMAWPWEWDGRDAVQPGQGGDDEQGVEPRPPVYRVRVRGTKDFELVYEIVQPDDTCVPFSAGLRREIGLVRLTVDDRNDRDLRLVQGSSLDRLLHDRGLRSRLGREIAADTVDQHLEQESRARLTDLDTAFAARQLPAQLGLAFTGSAGLSINALVGLTATKAGVVLPLSTWGAGTRRLAALAIADQLQEGHPIRLIDELERGLEPYRQRQLAKEVSASPGQSFLTTHSPSVLSAVADAAVWYVDATGQVGSLPQKKIAAHVAKDPEAFLARLTIVAEGATEVGFLSQLLDHELPDWNMRGVHITDGGGNDSVLDLLEALSDGGLKFAGFADDEGRAPGRWATVQAKLGPLLFRWGAGNLEQSVIPQFPADKLVDLITDPGGEKSGMRLRTLADRLESQDTSFPGLTERAREVLPPERYGDAHPLVPIIIDAALGVIPEQHRESPHKKQYKGHASVWFKSIDGGRELAEKCRTLGVWESFLETTLEPFLGAVIAAQADVPPVAQEDVAHP